MFLFVGSYATPDEEGIKVYRFSEDTGKATYISGLKGISNPSYLRPLEETASSHYSAADYLRTHSIRDGEGNRIQTPLQLGDFLKHQWKIQPRMDCTACHH